MKKRTISVGRQQLTPDLPSSPPDCQIDAVAFDQTLVALQSKLQFLEQKYTTFVTRCISILRERKTLLNSRISGEGGIVDDGFRREISELSKEKDRIEEDIQYMLDLKENSHRRPQSSSGKALIDCLKLLEKCCNSAKDQLSSQFPRQDSLISDTFQRLLKATQSGVIEFNAARSQQNQEFVQQVKTLQGENVVLEKKLKDRMMESSNEYQAMIAQLRRDKCELERQNRDLADRLKGAFSVPGSPSHGQLPASEQETASPGSTLRRIETSNFFTTIDIDTSKLKRKLISMTKERDILKTWKQTHMTSAPATIALMQQLRAELSSCSEKHQMLKAYFGEKVDAITDAANGFVAAADKVATGRRDQTAWAAYIQAKTTLEIALDGCCARPGEFENVQTHSELRTVCTQTNIDFDDPKHTMRRKYAEESEKLAEIKQKVDFVNEEKAKLQQTLEVQARQQRELIQDCIEMKSEISGLKDLNFTLERDKKAVCERLSLEKAAKEKMRDEMGKFRINMYEWKAMIEKLMENFTVKSLEIGAKCATLNEFVIRVKHDSDTIKAVKRRFAAAKLILLQANNSAKTHISTLQTMIKSKESDILHMQSQFQHQIREKNNEISELAHANEALQGEIRKMMHLCDEFKGKIADFDESLRKSVENNRKSEEDLEREKEISSELFSELEAIKSQLNSLESTKNSDLDHVLESLRSEKEALEREIEVNKQRFIDEITTSKKKFDEKEQNHNQAMTDLRSEIETIRLDLETERRKVIVSENSLAAFVVKEAEFKAEIDRLVAENQSKIELFAREKSRFETQIADQSQIIDSLKCQIIESKAVADAAGLQRSDSEAVITRLTSQLSDSNQHIADLESQFAESEMTLQSITLLFDTPKVPLSASVQSLIADFKVAQAEITDTKSCLRECQNSIDELKLRITTNIRSLANDSKSVPEASLGRQFDLLMSIIDEKIRNLASENDALKLSKTHLGLLFKKIDEENEVLTVSLERVYIEMEDIRSSAIRVLDSSPPLNRISLGLDTQLSDWESEREALLQAFAKERFELIAASEAECQYLKTQLSKQTAPRPQVIVAEELMSDIEVQHVSESFEVKIVPVESETAAEPNRAFYTLFRAISAHAEANNTEIDEIVSDLQRRFVCEKLEIQPFGPQGCEKQVQTSFKYREIGSYLSMEEEISAVQQALRQREEVSDRTESFERVSDLPFDFQYRTPSFEVSGERGIDGRETSDMPSTPPRQLQTEPQEDLSVIQHYRNLEKDLEDEIKTNKLMQQQIQLLKEEIQQKDRQLTRLSEAKPQLNGEVLASAFLKLARMLPHL